MSRPAGCVALAALGAAATLASCSDGPDERGADAAPDAGADADAAVDAASDDPARIAPQWEQELGAVSPRLLGHNTVWVRGGLGLWDEQTEAPDPAVLDLVRALRPGILRFPGGTRAMRYDFSRAIGPRAQREPQCDAFLGTLDATGYGLDEFLAIAADLGAEVTLVAPWVDGSPEQTAALVAYVDAPIGSPVEIGLDERGRDWGTAAAWAALRGDHGHPDPWGASFLEIGNEQYLGLRVGPAESCGRPSRFRQSERWVGDQSIPTTAADHAAQVARTGALVRAIDPAIRISASAMSNWNEGDDATTAVGTVDVELGTGDPWNARLIEDAGEAFDDFILHPYQLGDGDRLLAEKLRATVVQLRALAPDKGFVVSEFGFLFHGDSQLNAIVSADMVRVSVEEGVEACLRHLLIEDEPDGLFASSAAILGPEHTLSPAYWVLAAMTSSLQELAVPVSSPLEDVVLLATRDDPGRNLGVVLIDRRESGAPTRVSLQLPPGRWSGEWTEVHADDPTTAEAVRSVEPVGPAEGSLDLTLSPHGVGVLRLAH